MKQDLLSEATRALRDVHENPADSSRFTRSRVLSSLRQDNVKRRTRLAFLIPLAACFVSLTAWGAASGRLPNALKAAAVALGIESPAPPPPSPAPAARGPAARPTTSPPPPAPVTEPAVDEPTPESPRAVPAPAAPRSSTPLPAASAPDPTHDLYRTAHRAHFVEQNPAAALPAWDEYLRAAPNGRFAIEARYNRALCLARLGRNAEAREALAPFAAGNFNGYRQREAAELRAAIEGKP